MGHDHVSVTSNIISLKNISHIINTFTNGYQTQFVTTLLSKHIILNKRHQATKSGINY